jgi:16S rRNA (adenine1518-N6/adenine1519-N6)-dimethyltransferase
MAAKSYPSPRALLERYDLRAKKSWGQHFLWDEAILDEIARLAVHAPGERVVELGSGLGHLTARLVAAGAQVVAVERDRDMARVLRGELGEQIELLEADAAHLDYRALAAGAGRVAVAGNLPYHLTSPILFDLLEQVEHVSSAVFLVQREVAERLAASPGTKDWGVLSVFLQQRAHVTLERVVPPGAFLPPPKVESAVVAVTFSTTPRVEVADPELFRGLVRAGFGQRRKTLSNALRSCRQVTAEQLGAAFPQVGIDPGRRGESLTVAEWAALVRALIPSR